ncbi:GIY-YIG nuclease family protein [Arundinibacter roseus]|uniref:GIY-YIG nuclease family protein n=1 Tax=Arundinibacter roseus TaxID=2070510 RepID=A0A4R4JRD6_9BACT|nr:GIY-YIG nuclease family protein [Arundinibacter roseus]TDB57117.1 GIY-YIG nuclease family protein [Arundinibacter roseus]
MISEKINALGFIFDQQLDVKGRISISDLFPKSKSRCGLYLLSFSDDTFYIGQAIDTVRRFSQHQKHHKYIIKLWFQPLNREVLNISEKRIIELAETSGLLLTNKTFVSNIIGETDLDLIISSNEQYEWLENNRDISNESYNLFGTIDLKYKIKYRQNFEKFQHLNNYTELKEILSIYLSKCIPANKKTEMSFWSLSCFPSTNSGTWPRYFCLNINSMEVFVLGYEKKTKIPYCFMIISNRFNKDKNKISKLNKKYKSIIIEKSDYRAAGADQIRLHCTDLQDLKTLILSENEIISSIKEMNLRLMRKGGTIYSPFHCFDLANDVTHVKLKD